MYLVLVHCIWMLGPVPAVMSAEKMIRHTYTPILDILETSQRIEKLITASLEKNDLFLFEVLFSDVRNPCQHPLVFVLQSTHTHFSPRASSSWQQTLHYHGHCEVLPTCTPIWIPTRPSSNSDGDEAPNEESSSARPYHQARVHSDRAVHFHQDSFLLSVFQGKHTFLSYNI